MIKAVVFDWGGVISTAGAPDEVSLTIANSLGIDTQRARELFRIHSKGLKRGKISDAEFWDLMAEAHGGPIESHQRAVWSDVEAFRPHPIMAELVQTLKDWHYKVAVLSNTFPATAQGIRAQGWYDTFDVALASSEVGFAKPDGEFYQMLLDRLGLRGRECVFIDDQQYCLNASRPFEMFTILAKSPEQVRRDLLELLSFPIPD